MDSLALRLRIWPRTTRRSGACGRIGLLYMSRTLFSVVVPCYNEEATLERSVSALFDVFGEDAPVDLEVIVVDDASTDPVSWRES